MDNAPQSKRGLTLLSLLILIALIGVGFLAWQYRQLSHELHKVHHEFDQQQDAQNKTVTDLTQQINQANQTLTQQQATLEKISARDVTQWKINEIAYLVRLAQIQLTTNHSVVQALILLKQAQQLVTELQDPTLSDFQQHLAQNIVTLTNLPVVNISGLFAQFSQLRDQIPGLSILVAPPATMPAFPQGVTEHKKWFQRAWDNVKASFKALVVVTHQEELMPAILTPEQRIYLQQNLELQLMQAQWALLNYQPAVYQQSLTKVEDWTKKFYVQNSAPTQTFLKQIDALRAIDIAPALPDLNATLATLPHGVA